MITWQSAEKIGYSIAIRKSLVPVWDNSVSIDDVVQYGIELLIKSNKYKITEDGIDIDEPLFYVVMFHKMIDALKNRKLYKRSDRLLNTVQTSSLDDDFVDDQDKRDELVDCKQNIEEILEQKERLIEAMSPLTPDQIRVMFFYGTGYSSEEIAKIMNTSKSSIASKIYRAKVKWQELGIR